MIRARLLAKGLVLAAVAALSLMPMLPAAAVSKASEKATAKALSQVSISMTSKGIVVMPRMLKTGDCRVTVKNTSSQARGVEMLGEDKSGNPTVRYTTVLKPGKSESFRWYFAKDTSAYVRDILSCGHDQRNCMMVTFGQMSKAIHVM